MKAEELEEKLKGINSRLYLKEDVWDIERIESIHGKFDKVYKAAIKVRFDLPIGCESSGSVYFCQRGEDTMFISGERALFPVTTEEEFIENIQLVLKLRLSWEKVIEDGMKKKAEFTRSLIKSGTKDYTLGCNMDVKLRVGGRKAPKGGDAFLSEQYLKAVDIKFTGEEESDYPVYDLVVSGYFNKDFKYEVDCENVDVESSGIEHTSSGVAYLRCTKGGDWEIPVGFFIYWDGKRLRVYEPLKGNTINTVNKSAFGNGVKPMNADEEYCMREFGQHYEDIEEDLSINWSACLEDFESRLSII